MRTHHPFVFYLSVGRLIVGFKTGCSVYSILTHKTGDYKIFFGMDETFYLHFTPW